MRAEGSSPGTLRTHATSPIFGKGVKFVVQKNPDRLAKEPGRVLGFRYIPGGRSANIRLRMTS